MSHATESTGAGPTATGGRADGGPSTRLPAALLVLWTVGGLALTGAVAGFTAGVSLLGVVCVVAGGAPASR